MTKETISSKSPSPRTSNPAWGAAFGLCAGVLVCLGAWLNPLAAADRPALALMAFTLSLPLGAILSRMPTSPRDAGGLGLSCVLAQLVLAASVSIAEPVLFVRTASWCVATGLLGLCVGAIGRGAGVVAMCFWLFLNGLPFFYDRMPMFAETLEAWALQGCPWLGFSADVFGGDPLRRPVLYLGQWTELSGSTGMGALDVSTLWIASIPALASLIVMSTQRGSTRETIQGGQQVAMQRSTQTDVPSSQARQKLKEAKFFHSKFVALIPIPQMLPATNAPPPSIPEEATHHFNAFLSSARSVALTMRTQYDHTPGFDEWFKGKDPEEKALKQRFTDLRNESQKERPVALEQAPMLIATLVPSPSMPKDSSGVWYELSYNPPAGIVWLIGVDRREILVSCERYLGFLEKLVTECEQTFGVPQ